VGLIIRTSSDATMLEREKVYLGKLNMILVQVRRMIMVMKLFFSRKYYYAVNENLCPVKTCISAATPFLDRLLDIVDPIKLVSNVRAYVCTYVRPQKVSISMKNSM